MQRGRLFLILGLLLLLVIGGAGAILIIPIITNPPEADVTPIPSPTPPGTIFVAIAVQTINAGDELTQDMISGQSPRISFVRWQSSDRPPTAIFAEFVEFGEEITELENAIITSEFIDVGWRARYTIQPGEPILATSFVENLYDVSVVGSPLAGQIPPGMVGMSVPINRLLGVNLAIEPGDHVNVLVSMLMVDIDEGFQTRLPNISVPVNVISSRGVPVGLPIAEIELASVIVPEALVGRLDNVAAAPFTLYTVPSEPQRPKLITQQIIQDAIVLALADDSLFKPTPEPTAEIFETETPLPDDAPPEEEVTPTPIPLPDIITLAVTPDDSLALNYFMFTNARFTFTVRSLGDNVRYDTVSFSLSTAIERYRIEIPLPLPYAIDPPLQLLRPPTLPSDFVLEPVFIEIPSDEVVCIGVGCPWVIKP